MFYYWTSWEMHIDTHTENGYKETKEKLPNVIRT